MSDYPKAWQDELAAVEPDVPKMIDVTLVCGYHARPLEKTDPPPDVSVVAGRYFRCPDPGCPVLAAVILGPPA